MLLWLRIIRPQTLFASVCPVLAALILTGICRPLVAMVTILCSLSLQILSNLINDYYDFKRGADKKARAGFRRALAEGEVTEKQMLHACYITVGIAILLGLYLVTVGGIPILLIGLSAILFAWLYTATSHSLSYLGIADIFVLLYYGILASLGTAILQGVMPEGLHTSFSTVSPLARILSAGAVSGLISMCVLMINNLRDMEDDRLVGKRTFPVRFGKRAGQTAIFVYVLLMPIFAYMAFGSSPMLTLFVPAFSLFIKICHAEGPQYNKCLLTTGLLNVLYIILALL